MTHPNNPDLLNTVLQLLTTQGTSSLAEGLRLLLNEAMRQERSAVLQAQPYERSEERLGHANGFKPKSLATRVGQIDLRVPQVRNGVDFYPSALEKGVRSEQALLLAMGIGPDGKRTILGVSVALSEAEAHWRTFLTSLVERGLHAVKCIVSDAHPGLAAARRAVFPSVPWQRCQFHLQQNAQAHVPRLDLRSVVAADIRSIFNCSDLESAQARLKERVAFYSKPAPKLAEWMEQNLPEGFIVYGLHEAHRRRLRTSNAIERVNQELKRRTRVASLFPNEASLLRLVTALLCEISNEWATSKVYLNMNLTDPPQT